MPTINGITASIYSHEGKLEEIDIGEFAGGVRCYIPAHSGQQFWLHYCIEQPIRAKSVSVEFHVDGNRIDTQFPLAAEGSDPPVVGPVASNITSQYGKDTAGNVYRRDVFFVLAEKPNTRYPSKQESSKADKIGTIECKVFRAEKTGEWSGTISPVDLASETKPRPRRSRGVSHTVRLGAKIEATKTTRYTFKTLDPEDAPFAWFKFYYRNQKFLTRRGTLSRPTTPLPRVISRQSSLYQTFVRSKDFITDKFLPRVTDPTSRRATPGAGAGGEKRRAEEITENLQKLETDLAAKEHVLEKPATEQLEKAYEKLERIAGHKTLHKQHTGKFHDANDVVVEDTQAEKKVTIPEEGILGDNSHDSMQNKSPGSHS